jgi:hypothetical protein
MKALPDAMKPTEESLSKNIKPNETRTPRTPPHRYKGLKPLFCS